MPKFNLDEYEPVEDRIRRFYSDHLYVEKEVV